MLNKITRGIIILIGGGTGLVPLMRLIKYSNPGWTTNHITVLMGSKTKEEVFFEDILLFCVFQNHPPVNSTYRLTQLFGLLKSLPVNSTC